MFEPTRPRKVAIMYTDKRSVAMPPISLHASSEPTVVFDGGTPDGCDGLFANANFSWLAAASSFTLDKAIRFNGMAWWGGYGDAGIPDADDDFVLDILALEGGHPGRLVHTIQLGSGRRTATGGAIGSQQLPEYRYGAQFEDIGLEAGSYWASLSDRYAGTGNWFWETTAGGQAPHGSAVYNLEASGWEMAERGGRGCGLAFQLSLAGQIGEPSRLALLGLALAGLASGRGLRPGAAWPRLW
jgi:hypothetical protein